MGTKGVGEAWLRCTYSVHKQTTAVNVAAEMQSYKRKKKAKNEKAKPPAGIRVRAVRTDETVQKSYCRANTEHSPKNKQSAALLQLHAAEKHKAALRVQGISSTRERGADCG